MKVTRTAIAGLLMLEPKVFGDERGFFLESFNQKAFEAAVGSEVQFVQDNQSRSSRGVLRGLHYQLPPHAQGKLVRVTQGSVFDVAVDLRRSSPSFGRWVGAELSDENQTQQWLPPGLAHGFLVTSDSADFLYKTTGYYAPEAERCVRWDDPAIGIDCPELGRAPLLSAKDAAAPGLAEASHVRLKPRVARDAPSAPKHLRMAMPKPRAWRCCACWSSSPTCRSATCPRRWA
jgi:dTDP-4-dehydrorhamnose 3,5-epimerase